MLWKYRTFSSLTSDTLTVATRELYAMIVDVPNTTMFENDEFEISIALGDAYTMEQIEDVDWRVCENIK